MSLFDSDFDTSSDDGEGDGALVAVAGGGQPEALDLAGAESRPSCLRTQVPCGRGRWGGALERGAVAARMREGKATRRAQVEQAKLRDLEQRYLDVVEAKHLMRKGGNRWARKLPLWTVCKVAFSPCRRSGDLAAQL